MSLARDAIAALRKIVFMDERLSQLSDRMQSLANAYEDMNRRLARLEGKFELLESMGMSRRKRLPPA